MSNDISYVLEVIEDETDIKVLRKIRNEAQKKINDWNRERRTTITKANQPSDWAMDMASLLANSVKKNFPLSKNPELYKWAFDIDKINRIDGIQTPIIEFLLKFSQQDDFWKQQVRSGAALRRHLEAVYVKAKSDYDKKHKPMQSITREKVVPKNTEVVDPNSPGYRRAQEIRNKLAKNKELK